MLLNGKKIVFGLTSSQYAFSKTIPQIKKIVDEGTEVFPVMSYEAYNFDSKYGRAKDFARQIEDITSKKVIHTKKQVDKIENIDEIDIMIICPCSRKFNR